MGKKRNYLNDKIKVNIIKNQDFCCSKCGKQFNGYLLQTHHKNFNPLDNSIENLEGLCKNCHDNQHGRNTKRFTNGSITDARIAFWKYRLENLRL